MSLTLTLDSDPKTAAVLSIVRLRTSPLQPWTRSPPQPCGEPHWCSFDLDLDPAPQAGKSSEVLLHVDLSHTAVSEDMDALILDMVLLSSLRDTTGGQCTATLFTPTLLLLMV